MSSKLFMALAVLALAVATVRPSKARRRNGSASPQIRCTSLTTRACRRRSFASCAPRTLRRPEPQALSPFACRLLCDRRGRRVAGRWERSGHAQGRRHPARASRHDPFASQCERQREAGVPGIRDRREGPAQHGADAVTGERKMLNTIEVDALEFLVLVDNVTDSLSSNPPAVLPSGRSCSPGASCGSLPGRISAARITGSRCC